MNKQKNFSATMARNIQTILSSLVFILFMTTAAAAATNHYAKHGISFDYPTKYSLSEKSKKSSEVITLKAGWDVIEVRVMNNVLFDNYDEIVIDALTKQFKSMGYSVNEGIKENKAIPLQVKGEKSPVNVDAVKFNQTIGVVEGDVRLDLIQTIFFFSHGVNGYTVDDKEYTENKEKSGLY